MAFPSPEVAWGQQVTPRSHLSCMLLRSVSTYVGRGRVKAEHGRGGWRPSPSSPVSQCEFFVAKMNFLI